jgi:hypothetical protein
LTNGFENGTDFLQGVNHRFTLLANTSARSGACRALKRVEFMIYTTLKASFFIAVIALAASQWAYSQADRAALARLTAQAAARFDPPITGSIIQSVQTARIDPCTGATLR